MNCPIICCYKNQNVTTTEVSSTMALVKVTQGVLQGVFCDHIEKYIAFKGIPYAKPPVGNLRFKAPEPPASWEGVRDASEHGPVCPQYNERLNRIEVGSEDCLYLNVYTKTLTPPQPLPVMVWIHGGGFYTGSGNSDYYGPDFFVANDVILVTFNYRLEVFGFLCLDTEEVPGNAGMKDQVMALKWVKTNISAFGGDPNNITIFGCSAGSASVSYHLISNMSEGLFNKAICQSGVCLNEWSYNLYGRQRAFQLGKQLGSDTEDPKQLLDFLLKVPTQSLVNIKLPPLEVKHRDIADGILFGPVIEKIDLEVQKFIIETPPYMVRNGKISKVPIMVGYTSGEGIEIGRNLENLLGFLSSVGSVVPRELKLKWSPDTVQWADTKIRERYFGNKEVTMELLKEVVNLETDKLFMYNIIRMARHFHKHTSMPVYVYKFMAETERNYTKKLYKMESIDGVCHSDELPYQFNITNLDIPLTDESKNIIKNFVKLWSNFAKFGNPTPIMDENQWKPFTADERYCFIIQNTASHTEQNIEDEAIQFWDEIYGENV